MRSVRLTALLAFVGAASLSTAVLAQDPPAAAVAPAPAAQPPAPVIKTLAGGTTISSAKTIVENAAASRDLADFTAAIQTADLATTLGGAGPFTVFIPTHGAFDRLEAGTLAGWMRPAGKRKLATVMSYHVIDGALPSDALAEQVRSGKGEAPLATVQGGYITVKGGPKSLSLTDVNGARARVIGEAAASNGVIYIIDAVLQP